MRSRHLQRSVAELEFEFQGVRLEPMLQQISDFLDCHGELVDLVEQDLLRGLKRAGTGRAGLGAEQVLRSIILWRTKDWAYRELRERIADGFTLRQFTRFGAGTVAKADAFQRSFVRLTPAPARAAAAEANVERLVIPQRGGKLSEERAAEQHSKQFKKAQRFRVGIEGTISVLMRGRGMRRCRLSGPARFEMFVGIAVLANNLMRLATLLAKRKRRPALAKAA